jgi:hypothetical protein
LIRKVNASLELVVESSTVNCGESLRGVALKKGNLMLWSLKH